jgi:hypothetical protein
MGTDANVVQGQGGAPVPPDPPHHTRALEDLPPGARAQAAGLASAIPSPAIPSPAIPSPAIPSPAIPSPAIPSLAITTPSLRDRIFDDLEDSAAGLYGNLERIRLLRFLSDYPVPSYTYRISAVMARGERPGPQKLISLRRQGFGVTVNLCAEMPAGDRLVIARAGLTDDLQTHHIPIVDMEEPAPAQVVQLLDLLTAPEAESAYVHCEAGKCRTGVMTACYRMAVMGWGISDALAEARNFGCVIPGQLAFIERFGAALTDGGNARAGGQPSPGYELGRYPLQPPGSVPATPQQLAATITAVAQAEHGQPE